MVQSGRTRWVMRILVVILIGVAFIAGKSTAVSAAPQQTHMEMALDALKSAKAHLGEAEADKGGHRAIAIKLVDQAITHVNEGISYAKTHH
jgi:hypothetical protein